jgi:hypothetical protein
MEKSALRVLAVSLALGIALERVDNDRQTEYDQQYRKDKLQTVCDEYRSPSGLTGRNSR